MDKTITLLKSEIMQIGFDSYKMGKIDVLKMLKIGFLALKAGGQESIPLDQVIVILEQERIRSEDMKIPA